MIKRFIECLIIGAFVRLVKKKLLINTKEAGKYLQVIEEVLRHRIKSKRKPLKHIRIAGRVLFRKCDLDKHYRDYPIPPKYWTIGKKHASTNATKKFNRKKFKYMINGIASVMYIRPGDYPIFTYTDIIMHITDDPNGIYTITYKSKHQEGHLAKGQEVKFILLDDYPIFNVAKTNNG